MKDSKTIINQFINKPHNKKIKQKRCLEKLRSLLPKHLANGISFMYIKNSSLFLALNHPGIKMELNYNHNLIKDLLNKIKDFDKDCQNLTVNNIKPFVSNMTFIDNKIEIDTTCKYEERAKGDFKIETENKKLQDIFQKIKEEIKK